MVKPQKSNKGKVPKITEEEYAAYVNQLREMSEEGAGNENEKTRVQKCAVKME